MLAKTSAICLLHKHKPPVGTNTVTNRDSSKGQRKNTHLQQMLHKSPVISDPIWGSYSTGACPCNLKIKRSRSSLFYLYDTGLKEFPKSRTRARVSMCAGENPRTRSYYPKKKQKPLPQNVDIPFKLPKKKRKPLIVPLQRIKQEAKKDKKLAEMGKEKPLEPPKNGLLLPGLVPVAYELLDDWKLLIKGLAQLLHVIPVYGCSECSEVHVAEAGHGFKTCLGSMNSKRNSHHKWVRGSITDVLIPIDSYHLYDPFGHRVKHETRFDHDRIPAVVELCIQAGVEMPEYPSRRRTNPIRMMGKRVIDRGGYVKEPKPWSSSNSTAILDFDTFRASERFPPPLSSEVPRIAQETMDAYVRVREGVTRLMKRYTVKACGYCSEIHVGPWGHNAKLCGEFKHQWRDGKHGWQDASVDEVLPPNYVWHVRDPKGPPLSNELKRFYGKAPAVVEICMQAGAEVPEHFKPMMRLDVVIPDSEESSLV